MSDKLRPDEIATLSNHADWLDDEFPTGVDANSPNEMATILRAVLAERQEDRDEIERLRADMEQLRTDASYEAGKRDAAEARTAKLEGDVDFWYNKSVENDRLALGYIERSAKLVEALKQIALGEGAYSLYPLIHASNVIDSMKMLAKLALSTAAKAGEKKR